MDSDPILDSPPKRRKLDNDLDSDYGPDVFDLENETIATLVQPSRLSPGSDTVSRVPSSSPAPHQTQPTQIIPATPKQDPKLSQILVPGTSPPSETRSVAPFPRNASLMAPPGTMARPQTFYRPRPAAAPQPTIILDDPPILATSDSDDDQLGSRADIPQTVFRAGSSIDKFKKHVSSFAHAQNARPTAPQSSIPQKRTAEDSVGAYASVSRGVARPAQQRAPARAAPVAQKLENVDDITDWELRSKAREIQTIFPHYTAQQIYDALMVKKGSRDDAMDYLVRTEEGDRPIIHVISDDELAPTPDKRRVDLKPAVKRTLNKPAQSVIQRYGGAQRKAPQATQESQPKHEAQPKHESQPKQEEEQPRRRLMQGFRPRSLSTDGTRSSQPEEVVNLVDSGSDTEEETVEDVPTVEVELLKWLNTCSDKDMVEIAGCDLEVAALMISKRPFRNLQQASNVKKEENTQTKKGKARGGARRPVGERVVNVALEAHTSFAAVDRLVSSCEEHSRMIKNEMRTWGIVASDDGQSDDGARQDSGIGTPVTSSNSSSDRRKSSSQAIARDKFIGQPSIMSDDITLKDYQLVGLNWMNLLWSKKLSCILADEMGLGKTCQVIAFLSHLKQKDVAGPHLVVVPASTLVNWLREFERFSPQLEVQPYHGPEAERRSHAIWLEDNRESIDVIVTTYEMAVKKADNAVFRRIRPNVCIFDEGHALKNKNSQRYSALMRIPAEFRLLLTGTPLQNNLQEMISILAFLMPKMFEDCQEDLEYIFKHKAKTTDEDHAALLSAQRISRARSIITPFLLRRKKANVLMDLPKKTTRVEYCGMTTRQQEIYDEHSEYHRQHLTARAEGLEVGPSVNFLMNRRKAALHPLLFRHHYVDSQLRKITKLTPKKRMFKHFKNEECLKEYFEQQSDIALHKHCVELEEKEGIKTAKLLLRNDEWMDSGKVEKLAEILQQHAANGDRTLLFSQFTMVLDILELVLNTLDMPFLRIDGDTPVTIRQDLIDQFYQDPSIRVFMLSTRSGGTGINLAAANKVIIFDSSFNPQDDIQAENRAHRVGQTREVEVIRLVTRGTIEEQIHALGQSKLVLDERVAGDGDEAEKKGQAMIEKMLMETEMRAEEAEETKSETEEEETKSVGESKDLKDLFKDGLLARGVEVVD